MAKVEAGTFPKEMLVALSASTGVPLPRAYTATLSGTPWTASQKSRAPETRPPCCGVTRTS